MSNFLDDLTNEKTANKWIEQNSAEWDRIRVGRFTASEIWKLITEPRTVEAKKEGRLSETAMTYVNEKVAEVLTGMPKSTGYAFPIVWGVEHEDEAADFFSNATGFELEKVGFFPYTDHAGGSPDRLVGDNAIVEIKCPYDPAKQIDYLMLTDMWDLKRENKEYYWQCQANLLFTERTICHFVTYDPRMILDKHKMKHIEITPVEKDQQLIIDKITIAVKEKLQLLNLINP